VIFRPGGIFNEGSKINREGRKVSGEATGPAVNAGGNLIFYGAFRIKRWLPAV
jgi:hypothetical protein